MHLDNPITPMAGDTPSATLVRSPAAARTLAEGTRLRSLSFDQLEMSEKGSGTRRPFHTVAMPTEESLREQSREWVIRLVDHIVALRTRASDQRTLPPRRLESGQNNPQYSALQRVRSQYKQGQLTGSEFLLLSQLDGVLHMIGSQLALVLS